MAETTPENPTSDPNQSHLMALFYWDKQDSGLTILWLTSPLPEGAKMQFRDLQNKTTHKTVTLVRELDKGTVLEAMKLHVKMWDMDGSCTDVKDGIERVTENFNRARVYLFKRVEDSGSSQ